MAGSESQAYMQKYGTTIQRRSHFTIKRNQHELALLQLICCTSGLARSDESCRVVTVCHMKVLCNLSVCSQKLLYI